jgi:mono/diheme cytochrome c family protein
VDGATSRRFLWLPPAATIDTSVADHWTMPVGTRAWQELSRNGVRVETRFMQKVATDDWRYMTYHWTTDVDGVAVERGLVDAGGTGHDIPHLVDCGSCHDNVPDRMLGVSLLQLDHDGSGLNLKRLASSGRLSSMPEEHPALPSDPATRAALGYLHANCGSCHNPNSVEYRSVDLELWLPVTAVASLEQTPVYRTAVGVERQGLGAGTALPALRIAPGAPEASALYQRMASRDPNVQMPPIGTRVVDASGLATVAEWILSLAPR